MNFSINPVGNTLQVLLFLLAEITFGMLPEFIQEFLVEFIRKSPGIRGELSRAISEEIPAGNV